VLIMASHPSIPTRQAGMSLIDLLVTVVIISILGAFVAMRMNTTGENTLWYQAERLARDIQHVQVLASTFGRSLQLVPAPGVNGSYSVSCVSGSTSPCDTSPIVDPTTGNTFTVTLQHDVSLSGSTTTQFDWKGRPMTGGALISSPVTYTITANGTSVAVAIAPVTGFVSVTP
jgi:Tfp pilus assembly protein FimT